MLGSNPTHWTPGLVLLVLLALLAARCDRPSQTGLLKDPRLLEEFFNKHDRGWTVRVSSDRERVTSLVGRRSKPYSGEPRDKAWAFLRENTRLFGLKANLDDLKIVNVQVTSFSAHVELQQTFKELPVENGRVQINFDKEGRMVQVVSSYAPPVNASEQINVSKENTIEIAKNEFVQTTQDFTSKREEQKQQANGERAKTSEGKLAQPTKVEDVYFISQDKLHRAYKTLVSSIKPFGIKQIITDTDKGNVLQIRDFVYTATDGSGLVFNPNPVNSLDDETLDDSRVLANAEPPYESVALKALESSSGGFVLKGPYVVIENLEDPFHEPVAQPSPDEFKYDRGSQDFEDVMVYYHIDSFQRYIQETLQFTNVMNRQIKADAHACFGGDQSRYVSTPDARGYGSLFFGDGGVDDAEDADVIAHEYGHAILDNQTFGKYEAYNGQTRAMSEGFGDYWAASTFARVSKDPGCVMEWDNAPMKCLRRVDRNKTVAQFNYRVSAHINGEIWSATLFDIFKQLYKETADTLILQSHFNVPWDPTFVQGADSIIAADWERFGGTHVVALCEIFKNRGMYAADLDCSTLVPPAGYR